MTEAAEISGFCTIDEIVLEGMNDIGDSANMGQFHRYFQWTIRGYGQLRQFALPVGKEVKLKVNPQTSTVTLPDNYVEFGDIGINVDGQFWSFTEKPELVSTTTDNCAIETMSTTDGEGVHLAENRPGKYAISGGVNTFYYKKDLKNHRIIVYGAGLTWVVLKYVSTGIKVDGSTLIPIVAKEELIAWLHWQRVLNDKNESALERTTRERLWASRLHELRRVTNLTALYDTLYSTLKNSPKR